MNNHSTKLGRLTLTIGIGTLTLSLMQSVLANTLFGAAPALTFADRNFIALQQALPLYQQAVLHPWPIVPPPTRGLLKLGMQDKAIFALRARLEATHELLPEDDQGIELYDERLMTAVANFQAHHGLKADGVLGPLTRAELNIPPSIRLQQVEINLERWAQLAGELTSNHYIFVNVPDYSLIVMENNTKVLEMKTIVGKPTRPTPEIYSTVTRLVFNPYWNVPKTIAKKDIIPKVLENPDYLNEMNIKIINRDDDNPGEIDPNQIDWQTVQEQGFPYLFRQEPGVGNALGLVKFEFQNEHDVYMHDTPAKNLFELDQRDLSSGCIRLEDPFALANYLLADNIDWDQDRIDDVLDAGKTRYVKLTKPMPVIITYVTVWVDDDGKLQFRDDIYNRDVPQQDTNNN